MTWTFEVVPQTNMQSLRATIRSTHQWLTMETTGSTALTPSNSPPTQISTHASRLETRLDADGVFVPLVEQDRSL